MSIILNPTDLNGSLAHSAHANRVVACERVVQPAGACAPQEMDALRLATVCESCCVEIQDCIARPKTLAGNRRPLSQSPEKKVS